MRLWTTRPHASSYPIELTKPPMLRPERPASRASPAELTTALRGVISTAVLAPPLLQKTRPAACRGETPRITTTITTRTTLGRLTSETGGAKTLRYALIPVTPEPTLRHLSGFEEMRQALLPTGNHDLLAVDARASGREFLTGLRWRSGGIQRELLAAPALGCVIIHSQTP